MRFLSISSFVHFNKFGLCALVVSFCIYWLIMYKAEPFKNYFQDLFLNCFKKIIYMLITFLIIFWALVLNLWKSESESHLVVSDFLRPHCLYSPWNPPGQNTGVGSLSLLQGIFPTRGFNPGLVHDKWILYLLSLKGPSSLWKWKTKRIFLLLRTFDLVQDFLTWSQSYNFW